MWFTEDVDLVDWEYDGNYVEFTFDTEVYEGDIVFFFLDANDEILDDYSTAHFGSQKSEPSNVWSVRMPAAPSNAVSYVPMLDGCTYASKYSTWIYVFILADVILVACVVQSLTMSCKLYGYNGRSILVYAGWFRRYIKVNDIKVAERSTAFTYGAVNLSCMLDDGAQALATITRMNKISLYINNQFWQEIKK